MSKIISIHSYRGGTGKSSSVANIAASIARQGYRVGIVDTDVPSPGIHVLFGINQEQIKYKLNDFLWGRCQINDAACDVSYVLKNQGTERSKIYLVPSSVKLNDISRILREGFDPELLFEGFRSLIKSLQLDYLFIDTHPGLNEETLLSLSISNLVLLVLRPDQQDFQGTAVTVDVARRLKVPQLLIIVNKVLKAYNFDQVRQQIEKTYNASVVGIFPESEEIIRLASRGIFCLQYPENSISKLYQEVAQKIIGCS
jgi:MinD-like ATPase involved in chromosome partitioning or flagellar assembly